MKLEQRNAPDFLGTRFAPCPFVDVIPPHKLPLYLSLSLSLYLSLSFLQFIRFNLPISAPIHRQFLIEVSPTRSNLLYLSFHIFVDLLLRHFFPFVTLFLFLFFFLFLFVFLSSSLHIFLSYFSKPPVEMRIVESTKRSLVTTNEIMSRRMHLPGN